MPSREMLVVARIGVGFDAVDVPALTAKKIPLMVAGTRQLALGRRAGDVHDDGAGQARRRARCAWSRTTSGPSGMSAMPVDLSGKTVLVVGFGRIGTRSAKRCQALEMTVLIYDPYVSAAEIKAAGCEPVTDLDAALPRADFVTIHCPKTPETVGMFNAARLARMKPSAYLVNTARGGIIDEPALHEALDEGKLAGAGLDVFELEPTPADNPLLKLAQRDQRAAHGRRHARSRSTAWACRRPRTS